jgi:hypothetical protein
MSDLGPMAYSMPNTPFFLFVNLHFIYCKDKGARLHAGQKSPKTVPFNNYQDAKNFLNCFYYQNKLPEEEDGSVAGLVLYQRLPL